MKNKNFEILKERWKSNKRTGSIILLIAVVVILLLSFRCCFKGNTDEDLTEKSSKENLVIGTTDKNGEIIETTEENETSTLHLGDNVVLFDEEIWDEKDEEETNHDKNRNKIEKGQFSQTPDDGMLYNIFSDESREKETVAFSEKESEKSTQNNHQQTETITEASTEKETIPETTTKKHVRPGDDGWTPIVKP